MEAYGNKLKIMQKQARIMLDKAINHVIKAKRVR